jgi:RnfABCDGE-type electron transport complex B subunit
VSYGIIIAAVIALGAMAVIFAVGLAVATTRFAVKAGPLAEKILAALPGANCGACGYGGCAGYAEALASGKVPLGACILGGASAEEKIAAILGQNAQPRAKHLAVVHCNRSNVRPVVDYAGLKDCKAALLTTDALYECRYACLGLGTCSRACPFGAIAMSRDGLPVIVEARCTGCGVCVRACPKNIISLHGASSDVHVLCRSLDKGAVARKLCARACIACGSCVKVCPINAIEIKDFLARIDYNKCVSCGNCVKECPTGAIGGFARIRRRNIDVA